MMMEVPDAKNSPADQLCAGRRPSRRGRLLIDGRHGDPRRLTGGPGVFQLPEGFKQLLIGAGGDPRRPGALDVLIDDLRLSSVARYKLDRGSGEIAVPTELVMDEHTLGLFRSDGDVTGEGYGGKTYQADFTNRDEAPDRKQNDPAVGEKGDKSEISSIIQCQTDGAHTAHTSGSRTDSNVARTKRLSPRLPRIRSPLRGHPKAHRFAVFVRFLCRAP